MILKTNRQKAIFAGAVSFLISVVSSLAAMIGLNVIGAVLSCAAAGFFALTVMVAPSGGRKIYILIPIAASACAFVIGSFSAFSAIMTLASFAAGLIIARALERGTGKTGAVIRADAAVAAFALVAFAVSYLITYNTLAPSAIIATVTGAVEEAKRATIEALDEMRIYEMLSSVIDTSAYTKESFNSLIVDETFFFAEIVSPAVAVTLLNAFSYGVTAFLALARRMMKAEAEGEYEKWRLMPTFLSSWLAVGSMMMFVVMTLASRLSESSAVAVVSYVILNLVIILVPPMFICGVRGLAGKFKSPRFRGSAILITLIAVGAVFFLPIYGFFYGVMFVALQGAWDMILFYKIRKIKSREEEQEEQ